MYIEGMYETSLLHNGIISQSLRSTPQVLLSSSFDSSYSITLRSPLSTFSLLIQTMTVTYRHVLPDLHPAGAKYVTPHSTAIEVAYKPRPESFSEQVVRLMSSRPRDKVRNDSLCTKLSTLN